METNEINLKPDNPCNLKTLAFVWKKIARHIGGLEGPMKNQMKKLASGRTCIRWKWQSEVIDGSLKPASHCQIIWWFDGSDVKSEEKSGSGSTQSGDRMRF